MKKINSSNNFSNKNILLLSSIIGIIIISTITLSMTSNFFNLFLKDSQNYPISSAIATSPSSILQTISHDDSGTKHTVPLDQIVSGGPPADGIPSIDNPKFLDIEEADKYIEDSEFVLGLNINGDIRAYPLQILVWHEIVNDVVGDVPVAITYCPLCFTNQVFERTLADGNIVEFGTSGKLYNSNLVMYDRTSDSLWSQALGQSIVGNYAGEKLERIPFDISYWKEWKELYPESKILSRDTGSARPYGADPYGNYYTSSTVLFPVSNNDDRLGLKEIIVGFNFEDIYKAYKLQDIENNNVINDQVSNKSITLFSFYPFMTRAFDPVVNDTVLTFEYDEAKKLAVDVETKSEWNFEGISVNGPLKGTELSRLPYDQGFWFEWVAFHPDTLIYQHSSAG
ncbi:MAG: DUF3179 domain-containing protein [Nitrososphaeraceae archaeon]